MAGSSDHEFWKGQFDTGGNQPFMWFDSAFGLLTAADVLDRFKGDLRGEAMEATDSDRHHELKMTRLWYERMSVVGVSAMLRAMAVECLLKALWPKYGGKLADSGRYIGAMKKNEHHLHKLAKVVSQEGHIDFTEQELGLLEQASYWIVSGRYPIQKEYSYLVPFDRPDGTLAPKQFWKGDPIKELRALTEKLLATLDIKIKFQE